MPINAISPINFTGKRAKPEAKSEETFGSNLTFDERLSLLDKVVEKTNSNVHPSTLVYTALSTVALGAGVAKFAKVGRKFAVTVSEGVSKAAVKSFNGLKSFLGKKAASKEEIDKKIDNISKNAKLLRDGNENSKLRDNVSNFFGKIFSDNDKGKNASLAAMNKLGIKDMASALDASAGVVAAALLLDPASDEFEKVADKKQILEAINDLFGNSLA